MTLTDRIRALRQGAPDANASTVDNTPPVPRPITQDDPDIAGVLNPTGCPKCGGPLMVEAGVLSPSTGGKKRKKKAVTQDFFILQVDHMDRVMTCVVQSPDLPHLVQIPRDDGPELAIVTYTDQAVKQMCWSFLQDGLQGAIGVDHTEVTANGIVTPTGEIATAVENFRAPVCYEVNGRHVIQGSWVQAYQFSDDDAWESVLLGVRKAASLTAPMSALELTPIDDDTDGD